ncbi:MAG TPA: Nramp family divalent metal transporter [Streptosporangiaceae bacterium]|nr:Nramp family divalent metal transporter [Streptosporangiaceae bacterium]
MTSSSPQTADRPRNPVELADLQANGRVRAVAALLGPAFVAAAAYVDPGNFATNFAAGAEHGYLLLWVVALASLMAILVQYVTSKLGLATGSSLPELCRARFSRRINLALWLQGEVVAMATDLAEFTGAAVGLNLLFGMPLLAAGGVTAGVAFAILALDRRGYRKFELAVMSLLTLVGIGFGYLFVSAAAGSAWHQAARGLVPMLGGGDTASLAAGIVGATVMPHVIYLHSALHKDRVTAADSRGHRTLLAANRLDCVAGLGAAAVINLAMLCVAAALLHKPGLASPPGLVAVHAQLGRVAGGAAALAFAAALMASGLSSSAVGTYAGQVIMAGFMNWRIPLFARRALTMVPSLVVLAVGTDVGRALIYSQVALSFGIPFALIPLILIARDRVSLGVTVSNRATTVLLTAVTLLVTSLNFFLLFQALRH